HVRVPTAATAVAGRALQALDLAITTPGPFTKTDWKHRGCVFAKCRLLLKHYVTTTAPQRVDASYVRLPSVLVAAIDAFLFPTHPSVTSFFSPTNALDLLQ
ncbi:hypothetical protein SDRG_07033, partial [Saprolegnia diclina VS20]